MNGGPNKDDSDQHSRMPFLICKLYVNSMPIHVLQCVFHAEKLFCTHRFFHKYEQTPTEKFAQALLLILMRAVDDVV